MPRPPRLEYENAIYHIVTRGDGRRRLFHWDRSLKTYRFRSRHVYQVDGEVDRSEIDVQK